MVDQSPEDKYQALERFGIDLIELARKGKLRAIKQGRFWRFRESDIVSYKKRVGSDGLPKIAIGRGRPRKGDG